MNIPNDLVMKPGQGTSLSFGGNVFTFKATSEDTNGQYTLVEVRVDPEVEPPPHVHHRADEAFYIQAGELEFHLGDRTVIATSGTFLSVPKGQLRTFRNLSNEPVKMLVWYLPAGTEQFFAEVRVPVDSPDAPSSPATPDAIGRLLAAAPKYGIEVLA